MSRGEIYCGIDPGLTGALAFILPGDARPIIYDMPTTKSEYESGTVKRTVAGHRMASIIREVLAICGRPINITVERQQGRGGFNASTSFSLGMTYGAILSALETTGFEYTTMEAKKWRKLLGIEGKDKQVMIDTAKRLYPLADITLKKHHNRAEALLIARACIRINQGNLRTKA